MSGDVRNMAALWTVSVGDSTGDNAGEVMSQGAHLVVVSGGTG